MKMTVPVKTMWDMLYVYSLDGVLVIQYVQDIYIVCIHR